MRFSCNVDLRKSRFSFFLQAKKGKKLQLFQEKCVSFGQKFEYMKRIVIPKIKAEDLYVSPLNRRLVTNAEGWTRMEEIEKNAKPTGSLVMDAVAKALAEEPGLTADDLPLVLGTDSTTLNAIFRFLTGMITRDFLTEYRLKRTCELLACTNLRAARSGFPSQSELTKQFKARFRCAPRDYRDMNRPKNYAQLYEWD